MNPKLHMDATFWNDRYAVADSVFGEEPMAKVEYDPLDLLRFIPKNFVPLNEMMMRAGMSEMDIYNRTRDVFHHFKLPYDSEPPVE